MRRPTRKASRRESTVDPADEMTGRIRDFIDWQRVQNYSERTVVDRIYWLGKFRDWCRDRGITRPADVTRPVLERYLHHLVHLRKVDGSPLSFLSIRFRLSPVQGFFRWLARQHLILYNPAADLDLPRPEKRLPRGVLTVDEVDRILAEPERSDPLGLRNRAILETLYSTGIRRLELIGLKIDDIDWDRGTLFIRLGKGRVDRVVPIGERALTWIRRYLDRVRDRFVAGVDPGTLFLTHLGGPFHPTHLTQVVRGYVEAAGIARPGSCHMFRHAMATSMLENGADIRYIQQILGHAQLTTTQIYTFLSIGALKEVHARTHPAESGRPGRSGRIPDPPAGGCEDEAGDDLISPSVADPPDADREDGEDGGGSDDAPTGVRAHEPSRRRRPTGTRDQGTARSRPPSRTKRPDPERAPGASTGRGSRTSRPSRTSRTSSTSRSSRASKEPAPGGRSRPADDSPEPTGRSGQAPAHRRASSKSPGTGATRPGRRSKPGRRRS